jgi:hypothetical protein
MTTRAPTPEALETLLEDAFVLRDPAALAALFEPGAVLVAAGARRAARGRAAIARAAAAGWARDRTYVAQPLCVFRTGDTALVLAAGGLSVVRRGPDGAWRYAIALLALVGEADACPVPPDGPGRGGPGRAPHLAAGAEGAERGTVR